MQKIAAELRTVFGKKVKNLREQGFVPAIVYGGTGEPAPLSVQSRELLKAYRHAGESGMIELDIKDGGKKSVLIHEITFDPIKSLPVHVDFHEVAADKTIKVHVPIVFTGESDAVKSLGGVLVKVMHEIEVEALPKDLPHEITVDLSMIRTFTDTISLQDIKSPHGVEIIGEKDAFIAKVVPPRSEEELASLENQVSVNLEDIAVMKKGKKEEEAEDASGEE
ncbi:MAG: 50S ribosomal protein L25 [Candidatus Ryanbacteria bacterium]|nr:50S ribosomal protein L25 [Candidatus Ryanbacteria bacterium]